MQAKTFNFKKLPAIGLTIIIGISGTACSRAVKQYMAESVKVDVAAGINKTSESSSSEESKVSASAGEIQKAVSGTEKVQSRSADTKPGVTESQPSVQLNATPKPAPKASTITESNSKIEGNTQSGQDAISTTVVPNDQVPSPPPSSTPQQQPEPTPNPSTAPAQTKVPIASTNPLATPVPRTYSPTGDDVIVYASTLIGIPYRFGGTLPYDSNPLDEVDDKGFDAGGFVQYVFAHFNIVVGRTTYDQFKVGTSVSKENLKIGDMVFFGSNGSYPTHVAIYVGNNAYIHSPRTGMSVMISLFTRTDFIEGRRVIK